MSRTIITTIACLLLFLTPSISFCHSPLQPHPVGKPGAPCPTGDCCPKAAPDDCCGSNGAPEWQINKINANLYVADTPLWYSPAIGPRIKAQVSYNTMVTPTGTEPFGNKWVFGYGGYLQSDAVTGTVTITMSSGSKEEFLLSDGIYTPSCACSAYMELEKIADTHFVLKMKSGRSYIYANPNSDLSKVRLSEVVDVHGNSLQIGYSGDQLSTLTDALGQVTTLHYNGDGLVERISDPFGREALFTYDSVRNLISLTDIGGYQTTVEYREDSMISALVNAGGRTEFYVEPSTAVQSWDRYPPPGTEMGPNARITVTHPDGGKEEFFYDGIIGSSWHVGPADYREYDDLVNNFSTTVPKTAYTYATTVLGVRATLASISYANGEKEIYGYDAVSGKLISVADAAGNTRRMTYNAKGQIATRTTPTGVETRYLYADNEIDLIRVEDDLGGTSMTYNDKHQVLTTTNRAGKTTSYSYNSYGQLEMITDPAGIETLLTYDAAHKLTAVSRAGLLVATMTYDAVGRLQSQQNSSGLVLSYGYDDLDHITTVTYPDGRKDEYQYNSAHSPHLLTAISDRAGRQSSYDYDPLKNLIRTINPDRSTERFVYDAAGDMVEFLDPQSTSTTFLYDKNSRLLKRTYADGKILTYSYYSTGLLETVTNSRGQVTTYYYNENGNLLSIDYQDVATPDVLCTYDAYDRITSVEDGSGITTFGYDSASRLQTVDGPLDGDTLTYGYDDLGRVATVQLENGKTRTHSYDSLGRLTTIQVGTSEYSYTYEDAVSPLVKTLTRPNGVVTTYSYDSLNRLLSVSNDTAGAETINSFDCTYNDQDLRDSETMSGVLPLPTFVEGMTDSDYNTVNQLLSNQNPEQSFGYDDDGNMTSGYTAEGFVFSTVYDEENRLVSISYADGAGMNHETRYTYRFDSFLVRIEKYENSVLVDDTRIIRNGKLAIQERDASNNVAREYAWGQNLGGGIGGLLQLTQGDNDYSYLFDGKGNVVSVLDSTATEVAQYRYNSFGKVVAKAGILEQPFQFSTKRYDAGTGLNYYGYRFYNPDIERWMNRDPLGEAGGINLYGFVGGNPVNWIDQWGLERWPTPDGTHPVGRPGTIVEPGGRIGTFIEENVGSGRTLGEVHDPLVDNLRDAGVPDAIANIPTMLPAYLYGIAKDICELPPEDRPEYFPLIEIRWGTND